MRQTKKQAERRGTLLYYAPGGGLGHLTRAVAILRQWKRLSGEPSLLLSYSPFAPLAKKEGLAVEPIAGPEAVAETLRRVWPAMLVVDTFPRGILGEIAELAPALDCPLALVQRHLNPEYLRRFQVAEFVERYYRLAIRIGDSLPPQALCPRTVDVPPVTVRQAGELPAAGVCSGWLFLDWGEGSEPYRKAAREAARARGKELRVLRIAECYPAVECMGKAELAIGSGGYNFFHETALTATPAVFIPRPKMYDDQFGRTAGAAQARSPEELRVLLGAKPPAPLPAHAGEGAAAAAASILNLLTRLQSDAGSEDGSRDGSRRSGGRPQAVPRRTGGARRGSAPR